MLVEFFVNSQNTALVGQAKCVCEFLLKIMYWEHLREIDSDCEGERGTETRIEVD